MSIVNRYKNDAKINFGTQLGTPQAVTLLRSALKNNTVSISRQFVVTEPDRLDTLAGVVYGDATMWWALAASSGIGWGLQIPPGTVIKVVSLSDVQKVFG